MPRAGGLAKDTSMSLVVNRTKPEIDFEADDQIIKLGTIEITHKVDCEAVEMILAFIGELMDSLEVDIDDYMVGEMPELEAVIAGDTDIDSEDTLF